MPRWKKQPELPASLSSYLFPTSTLLFLLLFSYDKVLQASCGHWWAVVRELKEQELGEAGETCNLNKLNNPPSSNSPVAYEVTARSLLVVCREAGQGRAPGAAAVGGRPRGLRVLPVRGALGGPAEQVDRLANTTLNIDLWKRFKGKARNSRAKYQ